MNNLISVLNSKLARNSTSKAIQCERNIETSPVVAQLSTDEQVNYSELSNYNNKQSEHTETQSVQKKMCTQSFDTLWAYCI